MAKHSSAAAPENNETDIAQEPAVSPQTEPAPANPRDDVRIYIGPTMHRRMMVAGSAYRGGLDAHVAGMTAKIPEIARLVVPLSEVVAAKWKVKEQGTAEYGIYQYLLSVRFDANGEVRE
jgi:hypothetical protein